MVVKGINIENFKPSVCVPIVESSFEESLSKAQEYINRGVKIIEWRLDFINNLDDKNALQDALKKMGEICSDTVLISTIRTIEGGGNSTYDNDEMVDNLKLIAKTGACDFVDVEYYIYKKSNKLISKLKSYGTNVICSHHDFDSTPKPEIVMSLLKDMGESDSDVVKLAVMPQTSSDVTRFMDVCNTFSLLTDKLFINMSMGELGKVTRLAGGITGSCITFASIDKSSAPGQIEYDKMMELFES